MRPETKARIERAAALVDTLVSEFVRSAVKDRVERVRAEHEAHTRVRAEFFDELPAALDASAEPSAALAGAAERARATVARS